MPKSRCWTWLSFVFLICSFSVSAQTEPSSAPDLHAHLHECGTISGIVIGQDGVAVAGARVKLSQEGQAASQETVSMDNGEFTFANVPPGPFRLTVSSEGFATQTSTGVLHSGDDLTVPQIALVLATNVTEVRVELSTIEIAQEQLKQEEKQRLMGVFPNFYVTYVPDAAPLSAKQKYNLAWKLTIDPVSVVTAGGLAGIQQAQNQFSGYGQGAQGYAKRFAATYTSFTIGNFLGSAVFPALFKQDPRYFYKGTGSAKSRILYALANAVICRGDNGHWQANYSGIVGSLGAGGISNLYYPASDRSGVALTFENTAIGIGTTAAFNLMQEFVLRKLTSNVPITP
jgi:hypothetical protein